jgi:phage shock protein C
VKKLYRSETNRIFAGVIGGLGEYFEVDPVLLRVAFIVLLVATGLVPMFIAYVLCILVIPREASAPTVVDVEEERND